MPLLHGTPHEREPERFGRCGHIAAGCERIARVDHHIGAGEQAFGIAGVEAFGHLGHHGVRGEGGDGTLGGCGLQGSDVLHPVRQLALQVGELDDVVVDHRDGADARGGQGEQDGEPSPPAPMIVTCAALRRR